MSKVRYALCILVGLAFIMPGGAVATATDAMAQSNNPSPRINLPHLRLPKVIKRIIPKRLRPADKGESDGAESSNGGKPAATNQATKPKPPAKKRRTASRPVLPGLPGGRPIYSPDELNRHPLGPYLVGHFDSKFFLVLLPEDSDAAIAEEIAQTNGVELIERLPLSFMAMEIVRFQVADDQSVPAVVRDIAAANPSVFPQPDYIYYQQGDIAANSIQYAPKKIHVGEAHQIAKGRNVLVAVIDSGIDTGHPELKTAVVESFEAIAFDPADEMRHGTAMAAVIAANSQLLGIAPSVRLLSARAFGVPKGGSKASATTFAILKSMQWSFDRGARIFNLSFAGPRDPALMKGLDALAAHDVIMVAAAGNAGPDAPPAYPGAHSGVIAVTATDTADVLFDMANNGKYIALAAPGVDVMTATPGKRYELMSGTSVAAAHVTGVVALMMEMDSGLKPAAVRQMLSDSAIDLGPEGPDSDYGAGLVDALAALEQTGRRKIVAAE